MSEIKPTSIKNLKDESIFADGQIVGCVAGTITSLFEAKSSDTWEYQNGTLKGDDGEEIKICFSKCTQPKTVKGKKVTFKSTKTENFGLQGVKVEDSEYESKKGDKKGQMIRERLLKITPSCEITFGDGGGETKSTGNAPGPKTTGATSSSSGGDWNDHPRFTGPNVHPKQALNDILFLQRYCRIIAKDTYKDDKLDPELMEHLSTSLFIESCKNGLHKNYMKRMSASEPVEIKPAPTNPKDWAQCQIPKGELAGTTLKDLSDERLLVLYRALQEKKSTTDFANCVYQATQDRQLVKPAAPDPGTAPDDENDDIPF